MKPISKLLFLLIILSVSNIVGCTTPTSISTSTATATKTETAIPTKTPTIAVLSPTNTTTPLPTETFTPLPPQDFNAADISTFTPSSPALCPTTDPNLEFDVESAQKASGSSDSNRHFIEYVLSFLNAGGTTKSILPAYQIFYGRQINPFFQVHDVTGDTVQELIFPFGIWLDIFGCKNGKYELLETVADGGALGGSRIFEITDTNRNGLDEIIAWFDGCLGNRCPAINVYEWNGSEFQELIADISTSNGCKSLSVAPFEVQIQDIDNNGTKEIILSNNGNPHPDNDFPYRKETRICMWNGRNIVVYKSEFDAPFYRFQAVQDGDRATLSGEYDKALDFYQKTISDMSLEWFTQERKWYDFWIYNSKYFSPEPAPTASPTMMQDPNEFPNLAAYAYYRIMLLYVLQNDTVKAHATFSKLQSEFSPGDPGDYFAQVSSVFWQEYQQSTNTQSSCNKVIEYAQTHPLPIEYLGDWDHGVQSIRYMPETICPFR